MSRPFPIAFVPPDMRLPNSDVMLQDAARLGLQSALAAVATVLVLGALGIEGRFLGVISSVLVLDPSRDATIGNAGQRMMATIVGTAVGGLALLVAPQGYVFALGGAMLLMGALALIKREWRYGLVAAAGIAFGPQAAAWDVALDRVVAIFIGASLGIAAGFLILPKSARSYALGHLVAALQACSDLLDRSVQAAIDPAHRDLSGLHDRFSTRIKRASQAAESVRLGVTGGKLALQHAIHSVERLWHALIILDRVSEEKHSARLAEYGPLESARELQGQCCEALSCIDRFERPSEGLLERIDESCAALNEDLKSTGGDAIRQFGLIYGMHEVARNIRELADGIPRLKRI